MAWEAPLTDDLFTFLEGRSPVQRSSFTWGDCPIALVECPAFFVPLEKRYRWNKTSVQWHEGRSIQRSKS
jgi:hypothetical protein